jgi:peptide/nickel transport system permease protein
MATNIPASAVKIQAATPVQRGVSPGARDAAAFFHNPLAVTGFIILVGIVLVAVLAPLLAPFPKGYGTAADILQAPSATHWFGTDDLGLDIYGEVVWGARVTIIIGVLASALALLIGVPIGLVGGFYKGKVDAILTGLTDVFLSLPMLPLMILMAAVLGPSLGNTALVIGLVSWPQTARVVRGVTLSTVGQPFVEAAVSVGCKTGRLLRSHVLPSAVPTLVVNVLLTISRAILSEAGLSFLGLGDPLQWSWGRILQNAQVSGAFATAWWFAFFPSVAIALLVIATTFVGTVLNEIANPHLKRRS